MNNENTYNSRNVIIVVLSVCLGLSVFYNFSLSYEIKELKEKTTLEEKALYYLLMFDYFDGSEFDFADNYYIQETYSDDTDTDKIWFKYHDLSGYFYYNGTEGRFDEIITTLQIRFTYNGTYYWSKELIFNPPKITSVWISDD